MNEKRVILKAFNTQLGEVMDDLRGGVSGGGGDRGG